MRRIALTLLLVFAVTACGGSSAPGPKAPPALTVKTVLSTHGSGGAQTTRFTVAAQWSIHYSFSCGKHAHKGNFGVAVVGKKNAESLVNHGVTVLAQQRGHGVVHNDHAGTYSLIVNSECQWKLTVVSGE